MIQMGKSLVDTDYELAKNTQEQFLASSSKDSSYLDQQQERIARKAGEQKPPPEHVGDRKPPAELPDRSLSRGRGPEQEPNGDIGKGFFSADEIQAIIRCNIQVNNNNGRHSQELMQRAIDELGEPPLETTEQGGYMSAKPPLLHQQHRVNNIFSKDFFSRSVYAVHDAMPNNSNGGPSKEAILLEIETLQRSKKYVKNRLFLGRGGIIQSGVCWNSQLTAASALQKRSGSILP